MSSSLCKQCVDVVCFVTYFTSSHTCHDFLFQIKNLKKTGKMKSGVDSDVIKRGSVSSQDGGTKETAELLRKLASKGSGVAAEYESKILAKINEMDNSDYDDDATEEDLPSEDDKDLEDLVQRALLEKRSKQREAIMDGSLGASI